MPFNKEVDLYLLGLGIDGSKHLTLETLEILKRCRKVFHIDDVPEDIKSHCKNLVSLHDQYWTGEDRGKVYKNLRSIILQEVAKGGGVASLTYGHPAFANSIHQGLMQKCKKLGKKCVVLPAVSSLDTMCIDLGIDYSDWGMNLIDSSAFVLGKFKIEPRLHTLLLQIGEFDVSKTADSITDWKKRYKKLDKYLLKFFPKGHRAIACYSDDGDGLTKINMKIGSLQNKTEKLFPGMTLYIPPIE